MTGYQWHGDTTPAEVCTVAPVVFAHMTPRQHRQLAERRAAQVQAAQAAHEARYAHDKAAHGSGVVDFHTLALISLAVAMLDNFLGGLDVKVPVQFQCKRIGCTSWRRRRGLCDTHAIQMHLSA